jgi:hypothetical protein
MIKFEHIDIHGWEAAIRGMRNPMNSWEKSDSFFGDFADDATGAIFYEIGPNDLTLMMKLAKAGSEHSKYRRFITVTIDITAPLYWWKEFDTYKVGTVANSCSTMHKIHSKEFTTDDFSTDNLTDSAIEGSLEETIKFLNIARDMYIKKEKKSKAAWWQMIQLLPSSYNQKRTVMLNYEVLAHIYQQRKDHKLDEWHDFCDTIRALPYSEIITLEEGEK